MHLSRSLSLLALLGMLSSQISAFTLDDAAGAVSAVTGSSNPGSTALNPQSLGLLQSLSSLNLSPQQALGGAGAMLSLAKNQLPGSQYSQLSQSVPGLNQLTGSNALQQLGGMGGLLGGSTQQPPLSSQAMASLNQVDDQQSLNQAFSALGMDSGMVGQFAPLLLQFLGGQGATPSLLNSLSSLWGAAGV